jgi:hypothetical protein
MKYSKLIFSALFIVSLLIVSCSNDDNPTGDETPNVPATYTFERNNTTTVDSQDKAVDYLC